MHRHLLGRRAMLKSASALAFLALAPAACRDRGRPGAARPPEKETATPVEAATPSSAAPALYFPPLSGGSWETTTPGDAGWNAAALAETASWASAHRTTGLLILHRGRILYEGYWNFGSPTFASDVASTQKSIVSVLAGAAIEQGFLRLDDAVSLHVGEGWSKAGAKEGDITFRHLVTMTSGLDDSFAYVAPPGTAWYYNNAAYHLTKRVLERATGIPIQQFMEDVLTRRVGMPATTWRDRAFMKMPDGSPMSGLVMPARDMARFGLLALAGASWDGQPVLRDQAYWRASIESSQDINPSYGYLWWLNGKASHMLPVPNPPSRPGSLIREAPRDLYAAMGAGDNRIYVLPAHEAVVVRQGASANEAAAARSSFDTEFWRLLAPALPAAP